MERVRQVEEAVRQWLKDSLGEAMSVDASGSRRELPALSVVVAAGQEVKGEHVIEAALRLIQRGAGSHLRCGVESARDCGCNRKKVGLLRGCNHARLREILLQDLLARITQTEESAT